MSTMSRACTWVSVKTGAKSLTSSQFRPGHHGQEALKKRVTDAGDADAAVVRLEGAVRYVYKM